MLSIGLEADVYAKLWAGWNCHSFSLTCGQEGHNTIIIIFFSLILSSANALGSYPVKLYLACGALSVIVYFLSIMVMYCFELFL